MDISGYSWKVASQWWLDTIRHEQRVELWWWQSSRWHTYILPSVPSGCVPSDAAPANLSLLISQQIAQFYWRQLQHHGYIFHFIYGDYDILWAYNIAGSSSCFWKVSYSVNLSNNVTTSVFLKLIISTVSLHLSDYSAFVFIRKWTLWTPLNFSPSLAQLSVPAPWHASFLPVSKEGIHLF